MPDPDKYARIPIAVVKALAAEKSEDFEVFLPGKSNDSPVLYRKARAGLAGPDFERLDETGVSFLYVQAEDIHECEKILEAKLDDILTNPIITPSDKAAIVHSTGATIARDLMSSPSSSDAIQRTSKLVDSMIGCVLKDPQIADHLLRMAGHERTTASHMFVVSALAVLLGAEAYGSDVEMLKTLGISGMLHDMGKLAIPKEVLNKTTPLTRQESELIQQHPIESVRLIDHDPNVTSLVRKIIVQHHERIDGCGYPLGVAGDDLIRPSRILSIVDSFHAMIGRRTYRAPMTTEEANRVLSTQTGKQFDSELLETWLAVCERHDLADAPRPSSNVAMSDEELSARHEHRPVQAVPKTVGQRRPRYESKSGTLVHCVYSGRLSDVSEAPDEFNALVHDISRGGLCILTAYPMYRGEVVNIRIKSGPETMWVRSTVAWCRQQDANVFRIGLRFSERIDADQSREKATVTPLERCQHQATEANNKKKQDNVKSEKAAADRAPAPEKNENAMKTLAAIDSMRKPDPNAQRIVVTLAMAGDLTVRLKAVDVLMKLGTRMAREALAALLRDTNPEVRERAVMVVGPLKLAEGVEALHALLCDPVDRIALLAAGALGKLGNQNGLRLVTQVLESDGPDVRLAARAYGDITGHRFGTNREGVKAARRYLAAKKLVGA